MADAFGEIALPRFITMVVIFPSILGRDEEEPVPPFQQLALFKKREVALGLSITFFLLGGYSIVYTYLAPSLLTVSGIVVLFLAQVC